MYQVFMGATPCLPVVAFVWRPMIIDNIFATLEYHDDDNASPRSMRPPVHYHHPLLAVGAFMHFPGVQSLAIGLLEWLQG